MFDDSKRMLTPTLNFLLGKEYKTRDKGIAKYKTVVWKLTQSSGSLRSSRSPTKIRKKPIVSRNSPCSSAATSRRPSILGFPPTGVSIGQLEEQVMEIWKECVRQIPSQQEIRLVHYYQLTTL